MDPTLADLVARYAAAAVPPGRWPTAAPGEGQSREAWAAETARVRELHNAAALDAAALPGAAAPRAAIGAVHYLDLPLEDTVLTARVYTPTGSGPFPAVAFLHGGGWWMGGGATGFHLNDPLCRLLCAGLTAVVVNIDYRLAPEHPYPAQLEDVYQALTWLSKNEALLESDSSRLAVLGISSGGNLAASVCLLARDRGGPPLAAQFLITPALDATASSPVIRADPGVRAGKLLTRKLYTHGQEDLTLPYISPLHAPDLSALPPAVIVAGQFDLLRDEGRSYAGLLLAAGVPVTMLEYPGTHTVALPADAKRWQAALISAAADLVHDVYRGK